MKTKHQCITIYLPGILLACVTFSTAQVQPVAAAEGGRSWHSQSLTTETATGPNGSITTPTALSVDPRLGVTDSKVAERVGDGLYALRGWGIAQSFAIDAQERTRHETRSGILEFEANGYPTDATVRRIEQEVDYQRAVQAYIHYLPAVNFMQWRNGHFGPLGGKAGDMIIYRTTEQKLPILTANDTTIYIATWAELSDTGGLLMYEVSAGPTGGLINDLWQRVVSDTGMVGPERGRGGKFLVVLEGTQVPENHRADFVVTSRTDTVLIGTRILTPDPEEGERILKAHKIYGLGQESKIRIFEAPNRNWWNYQPRGMEYWEVVHQAIQLNPVEERDMAVLQGLRNLGIEKGKPFNSTPYQQEILEEAALVGETWAMGNSFLKRDPVKHWTDDPGSQWQYILFMQSPLDQMTDTHMEIDTRSAYTFEAVTMSAAATMNLVDAGIQFLAAYKDDAGRWLDGAKSYELGVPWSFARSISMSRRRGDTTSPFTIR